MRILRLIPLAGAALLAACSGGPSDPSEAVDAVNLAVASASGEAAAQHVETMQGPGGPLGFGFAAAPGGFGCEGKSREGVTATRTCTYKDANGNTQAAYDSLTTASVRMQVSITGSLSREHISGTMSRQSDMTVSGLVGKETSRTWNGTSSGAMTRVRTKDAGTMQMAMTEQETISGVVIPVPRTATSWPTTGTITRTVTVAFTGGPKDGTTETKTAVVTFNGTQMAKITVNGQTFDFDLAKRGKPGQSGKGPGKP